MKKIKPKPLYIYKNSEIEEFANSTDEYFLNNVVDDEESWDLVLAFLKLKYSNPAPRVIAHILFALEDLNVVSITSINIEKVYDYFVKVLDFSGTRQSLNDAYLRMKSRRVTKHENEIGIIVERLNKVISA